MSLSVTRPARYPSADRDQITGGIADPFEVAATGLEWRDKDVHFGIRRQGRLGAHAGFVHVPLSVGAVSLRAVGVGGVVVASETACGRLPSESGPASADRTPTVGR